MKQFGARAESLRVLGSLPVLGWFCSAKLGNLLVLAASTQLGPYEIIAPLGAGGMGEVYRARDTRLGREVAIKVLPEPLAGDCDRRVRFEREARAVAALSHPNILAIHDYGTQRAVTFAVMELLEGKTLRDCLKNGPLPWREAVEIGAAVADGLAAAHAKGIIHRDLKPENLFLTADGRVKILDFGLARIEPPVGSQVETDPYQPAVTVPGMVMGTRGYMSPEQVRSQPADARSDIFSLGCVLYEIVTGQRAFQRETGAETMTAILHDEPPDPTQSGQLVPAELGRIIRQCLAKSPNQRLQSARDLALGLRATASDPGVQRLPAARHFSWRFLGVVAAVVLIGVIGTSVYFVTRGSHGAGVRPEAEESKVVESLAILPFSDHAADAGSEHLSDGTTMSLIDALAQLDPDGLRVLSWSAVSRYKGRKSDKRSLPRNEDVPGLAGPSDPEITAKMLMPFERFLRTDSLWPRRAWILFFCALVFCTIEAAPGWSHPDLHLNWDPWIYYAIIGVCGAVAGTFIARYRLLGMLAGALAGISSVLTAALVFEPIHSFSRIVLAMTGIVGLLPGVAFYCVSHLVIDGLREKNSHRTQDGNGTGSEVVV